jgi:hypothetical protein
VTTIANPPIWQQNRAYSARLDRTILDLIFTEGVVDPDLDNFEVTETTPQSLSVAIDVGRAVIDGDDEVRQGKYLVVNDAVLNVPITAAPLAPNDRIDLIVLRVNDPVAGSARTPPNVCEVVAIPGTPGTVPVAPAVPDTAIPLAQVYVAAGATFIATADITDRRTGASTAQRRVIVRKTANYTLALGDEGKVLDIDSASNLTVTIPLNSSAAFPIGTQIDLLRSNTGGVTVAATSGVTLQSGAGFTQIALRWSAATLLKRGTDEWVLIGDLAA